jgi:hypothetical protein
MYRLLPTTYVAVTAPEAFDPRPCCASGAMLHAGAEARRGGGANCPTALPRMGTLGESLLFSYMGFLFVDSSIAGSQSMDRPTTHLVDAKLCKFLGGGGDPL